MYKVKTRDSFRPNEDNFMQIEIAHSVSNFILVTATKCQLFQIIFKLERISDTEGKRLKWNTLPALFQQESSVY